MNPYRKALVAKDQLRTEWAVEHADAILDSLFTMSLIWDQNQANKNQFIINANPKNASKEVLHVAP